MILCPLFPPTFKVIGRARKPHTNRLEHSTSNIRIWVFSDTLSAGCLVSSTVITAAIVIAIKKGN